MSTVTRTQALSAGESRYFGKVCAKHPEMAGLRYVASWGCVSCSNEATKRNQAKDRNEVHARNKRYRELNPEKVKQMDASWRERNAEYDAARKRAYRLTNIEKITAQYKEYCDNNRGKIRAKNNKRHAAKLQRLPSWLNLAELFEIECVYKYCAALNGVGLAFHVDHEVPLRGKQVSGLHVPWNLRVIPARDNILKSNRMEVA